MLNSQEEVLCFYVQDIVKHCRNAKEKLLNIYSENIQYLSLFERDIKELNYYINDILDFVTSLPLVFTTRNFIITGANNDQVYIADWQYLKEDFQGYMDKIAKNLKIYYENIWKFYKDSGEIDETLIVTVNKKKYSYKELNNLFNLSISYLFDVSPLVYYDKFRDPLR